MIVCGATTGTSRSITLAALTNTLRYRSPGHSLSTLFNKLGSGPSYPTIQPLPSQILKESESSPQGKALAKGPFLVLVGKEISSESSSEEGDRARLCDGDLLHLALLGPRVAPAASCKKCITSICYCNASLTTSRIMAERLALETRCPSRNFNTFSYPPLFCALSSIPENGRVALREGGSDPTMATAGSRASAHGCHKVLC